MPPKKKPAKSKKDAPDDEGGPLNPTKVATMLNAHNTALQLQLAERQMEAGKAVAQKRELQQRVQQLQHDFEEEQRSTLEITTSMTLQYKSMQEGLMNRINQLEKTIMDLKDQLDFARLALEECKREKEQELAAKDAEIARMRQRMDEMAHEFGDMLKDTLEKMSERIEVSNSSWERETGVPMLRKLEEHGLGSS